MQRAVLYTIVIILIQPLCAATECCCDKALPLFVLDPLREAYGEQTPFLTPGMVEWNFEAEECRVDNEEAFVDNITSGTFFLDGEEYFLTRVYDHDLHKYQLVDLFGLTEWALEICESQKNLF